MRQFIKFNYNVDTRLQRGLSYICVPLCMYVFVCVYLHVCMLINYFSHTISSYPTYQLSNCIRTCPRATSETRGLLHSSLSWSSCQLEIAETTEAEEVDTIKLKYLILNSWPTMSLILAERKDLINCVDFELVLISVKAEEVDSLKLKKLHALSWRRCYPTT